jgi:Domain of unknown function (DUF4126)
VRIPAGALLAAAAVAGGDPGMSIAAGILGGAVAAGSHVTKASTRALMNTSPEPVSNWTASFSEDALSIGAVWTALMYPLVALVLLIVFFILAIWLLPKIWRGLKRILSSIRQLLSNPA